MTGWRIALSGTVFAIGAGAACSDRVPYGPPGTGRGGSGGRGGPGGTRGGASGGGLVACPPAGGSPGFTCPPESTAIACDLPDTSRELRVSNDHVYLAIDEDLYRVVD